MLPTAEPENRPPAAVEVIFEEAGPKTKERLHPQDMLFTFQPVSRVFQEAIDRWLTFVDANRGIANVFFKTFYEPHAFVDQRFLNLSRAAEAYHRQRFGRSDLPAEDHESRVKEVIAVAPEKHREWLSECLSHSDETIFRRRIRRLAREHDGVMAALIGSGSEARERFVSRVVDARNQLTHISGDEAIAEPPLGLFELNEALGVLVQAAFMGELGIPPEMSHQFFSDRQRYIWSVRRAQAQRAQGRGSDETAS